MSFQASCPTCGAEVTFNVATSLVTVCPYCETVCGRGDGKLESYGKVADLVQTDSPLQIGAAGRIHGNPFEIVGRAQLRHAAGGVWDEWYAAFQGGEKWGWIAEAQGRVYFTTRFELPKDYQLPDFESLSIEDPVMIPTAGTMRVAEIGEGVIIAAEGEIPYLLKPGETVRYADLAGPARKFATLDASVEEKGQPPQLYLGGEFTYEQLGLADAAAREHEVREVSAVQISCPTCGGSLELRAPDQTERICCPYCRSLHDVNQGSLQFLRKLKKLKIDPIIPLGATGELDGEKHTVIGFMQRKVRYQGRDYPWYEYLLYRPRAPFRWLIHSNNHWTLGEGVSAGDVRLGVTNTLYKGRSFRIFDRSQPKVSYVLGEFYWKVEVGEKVDATDFINPPYILSREAQVVSKQESKQGRSHEVNWTLGKYMPVEEIEDVFSVSNLPRPRGVAPNQPYPHRGVYKLALILILAAIGVGVIVFAMSSRRRVTTQTFRLAKTTNSTQPLVSQPMSLRGNTNIRITAKTSTRLKWAYVSGYFYNQTLKKNYPVSVAIWPGDAGPGRKREKFLSALPAGTYTLNLDAKWQDMAKESNMLTLQIDQGVPRVRYWIMMFAALAAIPIGVAIHHLSFASKRWAESDYNPFQVN